jgi:monofunctional biosynthetic peptidoglycan transglycosylase
LSADCPQRVYFIVRRKTRFGGIARALIALVLMILLAPYALAVAYRSVDPVSTLMLWRKATGQRVVRSWLPIAQIAPALPAAVVAAEDARFCLHDGIDFDQIRDALDDLGDIDDLSNLRGGSTLTQQAAKNLFLWHGRSYARKVLEAPLALWLNLVLPKRRLLEIYLNIAEWGPDGEFGAEAGASRAFGRSARDIDLHQAALLAAVLPNPLRRNARNPSPGVRRLASIYQARARTVPCASAR